MKKYLKLFIFAFILILTACSNNTTDSNNDKIVYTSIYPITDFTQKIAGDKIKVVQLIPNDSNSHDWEPTPQDITKINKAVALIYNGAGFEHWIDDIKASSNEQTVFVDTSTNVKLLSATHAHEDEHDKEDHHDAHIWLSPLNAKIQLKNIKEALSEVDPENKEYYHNNYQKYIKELEQLHTAYQNRLADVENREIVVTHAAFGYLVHEYNLKQRSLAGLENEAEPTAARMAEIIDYINENKISTIFYEEQINTKIAETIANETNSKTALLTPIESLSKEQITAGDDYFSLMENNLEALVKALK